MMKEKILGWLGIETYAKEFNEMKEKYDSLREEYEIRGEMIKGYQTDLENIESHLDYLEEVYADPMATINRMAEQMNRVANKSYAQGRKDAYAEMGIKALDARMNGETLYCDTEGHVITEMDVETFKRFCEDNEIEIGDIVLEKEYDDVIAQ